MKKLQVNRNKLQVTSYRVKSLNLKSLNFKFFILLAGLSLFSFVSFAQKTKPPSSNGDDKKVFYGVFVGPTIDWFAPTINGLERTKVKGGMIAGFNLDINLTKQNMFYFSTGVFVRYLQGEFSFTNRYDFDLDSIQYIHEGNAVRTIQTTYLTIPTGLKFRTHPSNNCVFVGKLGLYHNFRILGTQYDDFLLRNSDATKKYFITTEKIKNSETDAALFAESGYIGLGFEYVLKNNFRVFANVDYSCQFNYFSAKAKSNIPETPRFKSIVHSLHIVFGILF